MVEESISALAMINIGRGKGNRTYDGSVKKRAPEVGWILMSFNELNCRPKKLSRSTVTLFRLGSTSAMEGGSGPRPEVTRMRLPSNGPVPPLVIWILSLNRTWTPTLIKNSMIQPPLVRV